LICTPSVLQTSSQTTPLGRLRENGSSTPSYQVQIPGFGSLHSSFSALWPVSFRTPTLTTAMLDCFLFNPSTPSLSSAKGTRASTKHLGSTHAHELLIVTYMTAPAMHSEGNLHPTTESSPTATLQFHRSTLESRDALLYSSHKTIFSPSLK
jgi:hypothetical protein